MDNEIAVGGILVHKGNEYAVELCPSIDCGDRQCTFIKANCSDRLCTAIERKDGLNVWFRKI